MKKYIWVVVCFIWILYMGLHMYRTLWHMKADGVYTSINDSAYDNQRDIVYATDNIDHSGFIYAIGPDYDVEEFFDADAYAEETFCECIVLKEGELYALIFGRTKIDNQSVLAYRFVKLDPVKLMPLAHSKWFRTFDGGKPMDISKDDQYLYLTEISTDDKQARVYAIPLDSLTEVSDSDDNNIRNVATIRYSASVEASEGYYYAYASYENGKFTTVENGSGLKDDIYFEPFIAQRFDNKKFSPLQLASINKHAIREDFLILLAGVLFILALTFFVKKRNRVAYMIVLWEAMLGIVFAFTVDILSGWNIATDWDEVLKFVSFTVDDVRADLDDIGLQYENTENYYRTQEFRDTTEKLRNVVKHYGNGNVFSNLLSVVRTDDGAYRVVASANGVNNCNLERRFGDASVKLAETVYKTGERRNDDIMIDGNEYTLICVGEKGDTHPTSMLVAVIDKDGSDEVQISRITVVIIVVFLFFVFVSILGVIVLLNQARDLRLLGNTMMDVSQGGVGIKKPETLGEDMSDIWSGLMDIDRSIKKLNYIKYRTFEAYYKFAPKSVERLLGKTSITEVNSGDAVKKNGTIMLIDTSTNNILLGLAKINASFDRVDVSSKAKEVLGLISKYQENNIAYRISVTSDMSEMDLVLPENVNKTCEVGIELSKAYGRLGNGVCIFMHFTEYIYGVTIADDEASQYLLSAEMMRLKSKLPLLNELRLAMVVTGAVLDRELEKPDNRYIGFWDIGNNCKLDLYEILDACSDEDRHKREETKELFAEGLQLFYDNNYYLARNNFAKVIRIDHSDAVARWYLFTCEKHLDGTLKTKNYELS